MHAPYSVRFRLAAVAAASSAALALTLPPSADAGVCGDDVGGARVACACGDVVVSDTVLQPTDPVTVERCPLDGLFLKAPAGAASITLNLDGHSLVGRGRGSGVRVIHGGSEGARILGGEGGRRGQIVGFGDGVRAHGTRPVQEVRDLDVKGNSDAGISVRSNEVRVRSVRSEKNGGDGFRLRGYDGSYLDVVAYGSNGVGLGMDGEGAVVRGKSQENGGHGVLADGREHDLGALVVERNAGDGVQLRGRGHRTGGLRSADNLGQALRTSGSGEVSQ